MSESIPATVQQTNPSFGVDPSTLGRDNFASARTATAARLYMTSDLRAATGLTRTHLDYYLREGLILPTTRSESGYLLFDDDELDRLRAIIADRAAGIPLREIRQRLGR